MATTSLRAFSLIDGQWRRSTPEGDTILELAPPNEHGVLDHTVVLPDGTSVFNPMRVLPDGDDACEVVFTLRRQPSVTDEDFARDAAAVEHDLRTLGRSSSRDLGARPVRTVRV